MKGPVRCVVIGCKVARRLFGIRVPKQVLVLVLIFIVMAVITVVIDDLIRPGHPSVVVDCLVRLIGPAHGCQVRGEKDI